MRMQRGGGLTCMLTMLPRRLLFWLSDTVWLLLHSASKPRMPPTQSPMRQTYATGTASGGLGKGNILQATWYFIGQVECQSKKFEKQLLEPGPHPLSFTVVMETQNHHNEWWRVASALHLKCHIEIGKANNYPVGVPQFIFYILDFYRLITPHLKESISPQLIYGSRFMIHSYTVSCML